MSEPKWCCGICTFHNDATTTICRICAQSKRTTSACSNEATNIETVESNLNQLNDAITCRFCEVVLHEKNTLTTADTPICNSDDCIAKSQLICNVTFACGHYCIGLQDDECFGCLHRACIPKAAEYDQDDFCNICWVEPLSASPTVKLQCGHYFHYLCLKQKIEKGFVSSRLTFGFLNCPLCRTSCVDNPFWSNGDKAFIIPYFIKNTQREGINAIIPHEICHIITQYFVIKDVTQKYVDLKNKVQQMALVIGHSQDLHNDKRILSKHSSYFNDFSKFVMDWFSFYLCFKCKNPYYGGRRGHRNSYYGEETDDLDDERRLLLCGSCMASDPICSKYSDGAAKLNCEYHGTDYLAFKCVFCCSIATWFLWGTTPFCDSCYFRQMSGVYINRKPLNELAQCPGVDKCSLGLHPPNGTRW
eukprot:1077748_1